MKRKYDDPAEGKRRQKRRYIGIVRAVFKVYKRQAILLYSNKYSRKDFTLWQQRGRRACNCKRRWSDSNRRPTGFCLWANSLLLYHAARRLTPLSYSAATRWAPGWAQKRCFCLNPQSTPQKTMTTSSDQDRKEVAAVIFAFYEAGKNKDLPSLAGFHADFDTFTKFDENPPYTRQNSEEAFVYEQAAFSNISDYTYQIDELRIDLLCGTAVCTFYLAYKGMFVNDYTFEGKAVGSRVRATMVLAKTAEGWKIAHAHLSRFPEWNVSRPDE